MSRQLFVQADGIYTDSAYYSNTSLKYALNTKKYHAILHPPIQDVSTNTGGYCQAKQRLPLAMLSEMVRSTGELMNSRLSKKWLWRGRRVRLIDGTTLTLPDTEANQAAIPATK